MRTLLTGDDNTFDTQIMDQESAQKLLQEKVLKTQEEGSISQKSAIADTWSGNSFSLPKKPFPLPQ